jgi:hypothetical protein
MGLFHRKPREEHRRRGPTRLLGFLLVLAIAAAVLLGTGIIRTGITANITAFGLKDIGELATQSGYFTSVQTIQSNRELFGIEIPLSRSNYIFSYDGTIKAGLDFGDIDVSVDDMQRKIRIKLPEIKILSTEIDESSFKLYNESENILTPLRMSDVNQALAELKLKARETAEAHGIMENARENAKVLIRGFLAGCYDLTLYSVEFEQAEGDKK